MIAVLDYGMGNLHSVLRAIQQVGGNAEVTDDFDTAAKADALVVPGVGAFGACMSALSTSGFVPLIHDFADSDRPLFGVCLGLQVLFEGSDEDPDPGLGVLPGRVKRLPDTVKVPHMGWNEVVQARPHALWQGIESGTRFYFVHSYYPAPADEGLIAARCSYGVTFACAVAHDNVFAVQFHPEKSQAAGLQMLRNFVDWRP